MPKLEHWVGKGKGKPFNIGKSEVVKWLVEQSDVRQWLFGVMNDRGLIVYDKKQAVWMGSPAKEMSDSRIGVGGRPSLVNNPGVIRRVLITMGQKEWGVRELMRACAEVASGMTVRRVLKNFQEVGLIEKVGKKWRRKEGIEELLEKILTDGDNTT